MQSSCFRLTIFLILTMVLANCMPVETKSNSFKPFNIIIILADDMDLGLASNLEQTNELIAMQGAVFTNSFVASPVCCPSRASLFRGQYPHNTNVLSNSPPSGGFKTFHVLGEESETLAVWLNRAGYNTALIGKYMNGYPLPGNQEYIPPGWTDWMVFLYQNPSENRESNYLNFPMNENGKRIQYGNLDDDYSTDLIKKKAINFIDQNVASDMPLFLVVSVYAPHGPSIPALRHSKLFSDLEYPKKPSFNEDDITDKPLFVRTLASSGDEVEPAEADELYIKRTQTMQAVDDLVKDVVKNLEQNGQIDNTYIFFTSDNGFHIGEHRLPPGKATPYEEDIHVPLFIRGPNIQPGIRVTQLVSNIDIAPTIIEIAGVNPVDIIDGRSLVPLFRSPEKSEFEWRKGLLIEMGDMTLSAGFSIDYTNTSNEDLILEFPDFVYENYAVQSGDVAFRSIRSESFVYVEHNTGEIEYYDLISDPFELMNLAAEINSDIAVKLHFWLDELSTCASENCRRIEMTMPVEPENRP